MRLVQKAFFSLCVCVVLVVLCLSCTGAKKDVSSIVSYEESYAAPAFAKTAMVADSVQNNINMRQTKVYGDNNSVQTSTVSLPDESVERKLIYRADVSVEVKSLTEAESYITDWCLVSGGYIAGSEIDATSLYVTARIPVVLFDTSLEALNDLGKIKRRSISTEDVTEAYYDVYTRLETRYVLQERLQDYLGTAKNMADLMAIEKELNSVQSEIERMEGQLRRLTNQIDLSTVSISVYLPHNMAENGFVFPDIANGFKQFLENVVNFFYRMLFVIFYVLVIGIPLVLLIALAYFLCFGRIGLIRRLFKRLGKKTDTNAV